MEIERKFAVKNIPDFLEKCPKSEIEQGYLCIKPTVRIRKEDKKYTLNYKWKQKGIDEKIAIQNIEYTMLLTKENYEILRNKIENNMIIKDRYKINIENKLVVELDVFHGKLEGLIIAEVEFKDLIQAENFIKPIWLGKDITFDKRYDNTVLSKVESYSKEIDPNY